jgi:hypothetical protein
MSLIAVATNQYSRLALWDKKISLRFSGNSENTDTEKFYQKQCDALASHLLLRDSKPIVKTEQIQVSLANYKLNWINKGELIAGSYIMSYMYADYMGTMDLIPSDADIFFKSKEDAMEFAALNKIPLDIGFNENPVCVYWMIDGLFINLIYGIDYKSADDLVSNFDIRACSVALDPNTNTLTMVEGAFSDILNKIIVFNPVPRAVSVARLSKYATKGFKISPYQRLFYVQLLRSDIWSPEIELITGTYNN